jgi:hypothetical protein
MPTDANDAPLAGDGDGRALYLQRMALSIEELNVRIARLALALGVSLQTEGELSYLLQEPPAQTDSHPFQSTPERRLASKWLELRGLLVLRYGVEKRYVDQVGANVTRQILVDTEAHMLREGFQSGADGIDLHRLFDGP